VIVWLALLLTAASAVAQGGDGGDVQGLAPGATVRVTRTDGTSFEARFVELRPNAYYEVFGADGKAFRIPIADVRRLVVTGRREMITPAWTTERRAYDLYEIERTDGTSVVVAMVQWGMFRLERDGQAMGDYRSNLQSFEVVGDGGAPPGFGFDEAPAPAAPLPDPDSGTCLLEVTVLREGSGELEAGALVLVTDGRQSFLDTTDADGLATFRVPPGSTWLVRARDLLGRSGGEDVTLTPQASPTAEPARMVVRLPRR